MENSYLRAADFRARARGNLKGKWKKGSLAFIVVLGVLATLPSIIYFFLIDIESLFLYGVEHYAYNQSENFLGILNLINILISLVFNFGLIFYAKKISNGEEVRFSDVFEGFRRFGNVVALYIVELIFVILWGLLFIIPGIIAAYRYSLAVYILIDNPDKDVLECINESKEIMNGRKGRLFCLDFSFIGWYFLASFPGVIAAFVSGFVTLKKLYEYGNLSYAPIEEILNLLYAFIVLIFVASLLVTIFSSIVQLYLFTARAEFYKEVIENELPKKPLEAEYKEVSGNDGDGSNNSNENKTDSTESTNNHDIRSYHRDPSEFGHIPKKDENKKKDSPEL